MADNEIIFDNNSIEGDKDSDFNLNLEGNNSGFEGDDKVNFLADCFFVFSFINYMYGIFT